jgi:putative endonuclease
MKSYHVYILTSVNRKVMYIGVTNSLENRITQHREGTGSAFTSRYRVNILVYAEEYKYVEDAIAREKQLKGWSRAKKDALVTSVNPSWADLLETLVAIDPSLRAGLHPFIRPGDPPRNPSPRCARDDTLFCAGVIPSEARNLDCGFPISQAGNFIAQRAREGVWWDSGTNRLKPLCHRHRNRPGILVLFRDDPYPSRRR